MNLVLAAIDGSPRSPFVIEEAVAVARATGSRVHVLHVVRVPPELPSNLWATPDSVTDSLIAEGQKTVAHAAKTIPSGLLAGTSVDVGVAWRQICEVAKSHGADLIVMGSHGYGFVDRVVGTTAAKVVEHADRSVLVVRPRAGGPPS